MYAPYETMPAMRSPPLQRSPLAQQVGGVVLACFLIEEDVRLGMCHNDAWKLSQPCVDDLFDFDQTAGRTRERSGEKFNLHGHG